MKQMLCSSCGYPMDKDKDRIVVSTFTGATKRVRWYCGNFSCCAPVPISSGPKGILGKARKLLRMG